MATTIDWHDVLEPLNALTYDASREFEFFHHVLGNTMLSLQHALFTSNDGMRILMIQLPELGKVFDSGLSSGFVDFQRLERIVPDECLRASLLEIFYVCFTPEGKILEPEVNVVFYIRCFLYMYKKVNMECSDEATNSAFDDFLSIERELDSPSNRWGTSDFTCLPGLRFAVPNGDPLLATLDTVAGILGSFRIFDYRDIVPKHGPGSVADLRRGNDKYTFPFWPAKLQVVFPKEYFCSSQGDLVGDGLDEAARRNATAYSEDQLELFARRDHLTPECNGRVIPVPKTLKGPRLITVEPTAHQFLQQGLMRWIRDNMHPILAASISFEDQGLSRDAALRASKTGLSATVDLSSASDRLSCKVVERAVRNSGLLTALNACRTTTVDLARPNTKNYESVELKKFSGMGSAVTFPVQSIVYAMCALASICLVRGYRVTESRLRSLSGEVRVFGDDLIVPCDAVPNLRRLLSMLQLLVNEDKTHTSGYFRESCGMDAYLGYEVTPFYLSSLTIGKNPEDIAGWIDVCNNSFHKGLWAVAAVMQQRLGPLLGHIPIVHSMRTFGGLNLATYSGHYPKGWDYGVYAARSRINLDTQALEYRCLQLKTKASMGTRGTDTDLLQYFLEKKGSLDLLSSSSAQWQPGWLVRASSRLAKVWVGG